MSKEDLGRDIDFKKAKEVLLDAYNEVLQSYKRGQPPQVDKKLQSAATTLFTTRVMSYREALLGCALARVIDRNIDITLPYKAQGPNAFSGRSLDEKVVNPFLVEKSIPCSRGPYLATFRRSVRFVKETATGLRDKKAYNAFLTYLDALREADHEGTIQLLRYLIYRFIKLRYESEVELKQPSKVSLENWRTLIRGLISSPSGGLFPLLITVAYLDTLVELCGLSWEISWQGINVADRSTDAAGDITVRQAGQVYMAFEVTERRIDRNRVEATFRTKISPASINEYLFVFAKEGPEPEALKFARGLLTLGHEVNFVHVSDLVINGLAVGGSRARSVFLEKLITLLKEAPTHIKHLWNDQVELLVSTLGV